MAEYRELLRYITGIGSVLGVHTLQAGLEADCAVAGQFQNFYLSPGLRETTIGSFLKSHEGILKRAFSARKCIHEPFLRWIDQSSPFPRENINPDLLLEREDGHFDIYDLKTAALHRDSLTKGETKRRRFIDYVQEGIAQLANYEEYFSSPQNREYAKTHYNVSVSEPKMTLVVGNYDNADETEIVEASRMLRDRFSIIDYDTVTQLFLSAVGLHSAGE